jgi:hypothetical protein
VELASKLGISKLPTDLNKKATVDRTTGEVSFGLRADIA